MKSILIRLKKIIIESETIRLIFLLNLVIYAYYPFISGNNMGADDAHWYQYILHDAIIQFNNGFFPTYVGQSIYSFFGSPVIRAPYYILLGQILNLASFGHFSALVIQHLTVIVTASLAAFLFYFLLTQLAPNLRWLAVFFSFFYISCPGVIGLIYGCDMYYSFMVIPFVPLTLYGLIRSHQKNDILSYLITAAALSLIWMAHPPIAVWVTAICLFFYIFSVIFSRKGFIAIPLFSSLLFLFCLWQFVTIFSLGLGTEYAGSDYSNALKHYTKNVVDTLRSDIPGVFLPLRLGTSTLAFLQLGYAQWFIIILGLCIPLQAKSSFIVRSLLLSIVILILMLYPPPILGPWLWSLTPQLINNITMIWPQERFYIILSTLICFFGIFACKNIYTNASENKKNLLNILFIIFIIWNGYETYFFIDMGQTRKANTDFWNSPENIHFYPNHVSQAHIDSLFSGMYDPLLKNKVLNNKFMPINGYDNEETAIQSCFKKNQTRAGNIIINNNKMKLPIMIGAQSNVNINPFLSLHVAAENPDLLCIKAKIDKNTGLNVEVIGAHHVAEMAIKSQDTQGTSSKILTLPVFKDESKSKIQSIYLSKSGVGEAKIESFCVTHYERQKLPIRILSFTPYIAVINTPSNDNYLEIFKEYYPGYTGKVNGKNVDILASNNKLILIPLKNKGVNRVELNYIGTPMMRFTFYISYLSWITFILYLLILAYKKFINRK